MTGDNSNSEFNIHEPNVPGVKLPPPVEKGVARTEDEIRASLPEDAILSSISDDIVKRNSDLRQRLRIREKNTIGVAGIIDVGDQKLDQESAVVRLAKDMNSLAMAGITVDGAADPKVLSGEIMVRDPQNANYPEDRKLAGDVVDRSRIVIKGLSEMGLTQDEIFNKMRSVYNPPNPDETKRQITAIIDMSKSSRQKSQG